MWVQRTPNNPINDALNARREQIVNRINITENLLSLEQKFIDHKPVQGSQPQDVFRWTTREQKQNFGLIATVIGTQRFNELKELAFENIGGIQGISPGGWKHKRELLRLLQLEPQFFNQEVQ